MLLNVFLLGVVWIALAALMWRGDDGRGGRYPRPRPAPPGGAKLEPEVLEAMRRNARADA